MDGADGGERPQDSTARDAGGEHSTAADYLTAEQAARRLGIKRATLYAYVSRGVLRSYRQGIKRQRLYRRSDVDRLLEVAPTAAGARRGPPVPRLREWQIPLAETWMRD